MRLSIIILSIVVLAGCQLEPRQGERSEEADNRIGSSGNQTGQSNGSAGEDANAAEDEYAEQKLLGLSEHPKLRFKRQKLLSNDLQSALELGSEELCQELGDLDCVKEVHHIDLGGVDAYERTIYRPQQQTSATTPIIIERIVLSACKQRASNDTGGGTGAILTTDPEVTGTNLIQRAFLRDPTDAELKGFANLYKQLGSTQGALAACYATFTSVEFLFY